MPVCDSRYEKTTLPDAIVAREMESTAVLRFGCVLFSMSLMLIVACAPVGGSRCAVPILWPLFVAPSLGLPLLRWYSQRAVGQIAVEPETYVNTRHFPRQLCEAVWSPADVVGFWLALALTAGFILPGLALVFVLPMTALCELTLPETLLPFVLGGSLLCLCDPYVWIRWGRRKLGERCHLDPVSVMQARGYRWTSWWGWRSPAGV